MSNDSEKFCVKCIYYSETFDPYDHRRVNKICMRPTTKTDLVSGKQLPQFVECYTERSKTWALFGGCGPKGKFFLERPVVKLNHPRKE